MTPRLPTKPSKLQLTYCPECLKKQLVIDRLQEEIVRLKARLRYQERTAKEGPFGSLTPSAKVPLKANTPPQTSRRRGGAMPGHRGHGRRDIPDHEITREAAVPGPEQCPYCGGPLDPKGSKARTIIEVDPVRKEVIRYARAQRDCGRCHRTFTARPAGVFAKGLFGNRLLTHVAVEHYVQGVTRGQCLQHRLQLLRQQPLAVRLQVLKTRIRRDGRFYRARAQCLSAIADKAMTSEAAQSAF